MYLQGAGASAFCISFRQVEVSSFSQRWRFRSVALCGGEFKPLMKRRFSTETSKFERLEKLKLMGSMGLVYLPTVTNTNRPNVGKLNIPVPWILWETERSDLYSSIHGFCFLFFWKVQHVWFLACIATAWKILKVPELWCRTQKPHEAFLFTVSPRGVFGSQGHRRCWKYHKLHFF